MTRLAIIHTTPATIASLKQLALETIPGCSVINFLDDSILPQLARNQGNLAEVEERLVAYARFAEQAGADILLEACSSVGEVVAKMRQAVKIPVVRIDDAMAEQAVRKGRVIAAAATLETTLRPTIQLLEEKAAQAGRRVEIRPVLVAEAYQKLVQGDPAGSEAALLDAFSTLPAEIEVVVLAQASMAGVVARLPEAARDKFLSSPGPAMRQVRLLIDAM